MKFYFALQYRLINRHLSDSGLNSTVLSILLVVVFIVVSQYLVVKTSYSHYGYALIPINFAFHLNRTDRNRFLQSCFPDRRYYKVRLIENTLLGLPFVFFLIVNSKLQSGLLVLIVNCLLIISRATPKYTYVMPTPFFKLPFEFLVGFRKTFFVILLSYILTAISIAVTNFNLGLFSLLLIQLVCVSFYIEPERYFYVWSYSIRTSEFLFSKLKTSIFYTTILCLPILTGMVISFSGHFTAIVIVQTFGYIMVAASLLSKYAYFPSKLPLPELIIFIFALILWPVLLVLIPYFLVRSINSLKKILK